MFLLFCSCYLFEYHYLIGYIVKKNVNIVKSILFWYLEVFVFTHGRKLVSQEHIKK